MKPMGQETSDDLLKSTCEIDLLSSFKSGTNTIQWLHWLDILDQQTSNRGLGSLNLESDLSLEGIKQQESPKLDSKIGKSSASKDSQDSSVKSGNMFGRGLISGDKYSALKFPEAMVAIAQAAKDLPGWPLMPNKMQMHKCEKCSQEFCSPLNLRRHMRAVHRKPLNVEKEDLTKKREQIAAFWDKLSAHDANEIVSAKNLSHMDLSAAALVRALSAQLQQPNLLLLPQTYIKVATALLDLVQSKNTKMSITSGELCTILEDASEKNMLCGVTSSSMHRCIFDNDPGRVGLETKNIVASLGFLVEYKLVRAWMDDKDAEALRCQKALVEEEEAAQKRRAKLLERKKQRKIRIKECRDKERRSTDLSGCLQELKFDSFPREGEDSLTATQSSPSSSASSVLETHSVETPQIANGESEESRFAIDNLEAGQIFESPEDAEESFAGFSDDLSLQNLDTSHDSVRERDDETSTDFSSNGVGWKERRQVDTSYFQNNGKQLYGKDRTHYDHQYRGHRFMRPSFGGPAYDYINPRYGHYREKVTLLKRQNIAGTCHTVWAPKMPQISAPVSQDKENGESLANKASNDFTITVPAGQSERLENSAGSAESGKGLSRVSSLSSDSATSQSSVSISAKVGAEEQDCPEDQTIPRGSSHSTVSAKEDAEGNSALMIGSFSIPLEHPLPARRIDHSLEYNPISGPKFEGKNSISDSSCSSTAYERVEGPQPSCTSSDDSFPLRGGGFHQSGSREDSSSTVKNVISCVQNKSVVKVWRPVTPGERGGFSHFGGHSLNEYERSNATDAVPEQREASDASVGNYHSFSHGSLSGNDMNEKQVAHLAVSQGSLCVGGDDQQPDPSFAAYFAELLNFLAQRWSRAMSSPDIVCHIELDDPDSDGTI